MRHNDSSTAGGQSDPSGRSLSRASWALGRSLSRLVRLRATASASALTVLGGHTGMQDITDSRLRSVIPAAFASFSMIAYAQIFNDVVDRKLDAIGKPERPIPSGQISVGMAWALALGAAVSALVSSATAGRAALLLVTFCLILGTAYSVVLKDTVLLGNTAVAVVSAGALVLGGVAVHALSAATWLGALLVFVYVLGNELFKTALDARGDAQLGLRTIATVGGLRATALVVSVCALILPCVLLAGYALGRLSLAFTGLGTVLVSAPIAVATLKLHPWRRVEMEDFARAHTAWRTGWLSGLAVLLLLR